MRLPASLSSDAELSVFEASFKWLAARLVIYSSFVGAATVAGFCILAVFGPALYLGEGSGGQPKYEKSPTLFWETIPTFNAPMAPVDDAMLVASGLDRKKFIALTVAGSSVVDGSGNHVGALREVIIGEHDNVVGIVVRKSSGWLARSRDIIVPSSLYRFSNDKQFANSKQIVAGGQGASSREIATIDLSSAQIDALPSVQSLGK